MLYTASGIGVFIQAIAYGFAASFSNNCVKTPEIVFKLSFALTALLRSFWLSSDKLLCKLADTVAKPLTTCWFPATKSLAPCPNLIAPEVNASLFATNWFAPAKAWLTPAV